MGLRAFSHGLPRRLWVRRVVVGLTLCALVLSIPLAPAFLYQVHEGKIVPIALSVTNEAKEAILARVQADPGVTLLLIGRPGIPRDQDLIDVGIVVASESPLPRSYGDQLADIVREKIHNPDLHVRVACVAAGWAEPGDNDNE